MKRKITSGLMLTLLAISMLTLAFNIQPAEASGTIYIRANGSVDPSTANITSVDNVTYTFTGKIYGSIVVERSNIVIDGDGYTLDRGWSIGHGFVLSKISNVTIKNTNIKGFSIEYTYAISLGGSDNTISGNNITNNFCGIQLELSSGNNIISGNNITANDYGIGGGVGLDVYSYNYTISRNNITNNKYYGILLYHTENTTVWGNNIANNGEEGIHLGGMGQTSNNIFYHNNFINNTKHVDTWEEASWDNGYPSGGNYWDDYTGVDANNDGIGDTPHDISAYGYDNVDRYPLMNPWTPSWTPPEPEPVTPTPPEAQVGVKAGDWVKIDYTITGAPSGTPLPQWLKIEFLSVEGTTATVRVTMHMSDGTEQSDTMAVDVAVGGGSFGGLSGLVIPANCTTGDSSYMSGVGNVTLDGETTRTYAGASRAVVYASVSQYGTEITYYWDKETGVMVEASTISGGMIATAKATETNMWEATISPFWMQLWFYAIVAGVVVALAGAVYFLKKKKSPIAPTSPSEGTETSVD